MPRYIPLDVETAFQTSLSDLLDIQWSLAGISAMFSLPHDKAHALEVRFEKQCIVRLLDEMPLSTEDDNGPVEGLVSEQFAYRVEGARFWENQSRAFKETFPSARHYRLITGWTCMDVISASEPAFRVVPAPNKGLSGGADQLG